MTSTTLAQRLGAQHVGPELEILDCAPIESAGPNDLAYAERSQDSAAGALLLRQALPDRCCLVVDDPKAAFIQALDLLRPETHFSGIHPSAVIEGELGPGVAVGACAVVEAGAQVHEGAILYPGVVVGRGAVVGAHSVLFARVVLYPGVSVGRRCRIHAGAVIGADGFSYHPTPRGALKVPQRGTVVIEDGVEIGANSCVDRAFLTETRIGAGSALDNLVQIGHNARLGKSCLLAAQVGVAGSTTLGDGVLVGGQAGFIEHLHVGDGARVGAGAGVIKDVPAGETVFGSPALPARQMRRILAGLRSLPDWLKRQ